MTLKPQYIINEEGKKLAVVVPISEYEKMVSDLEMLEDIKLYDDAKANSEDSIKVEDAFQQIIVLS